MARPGASVTVNVSKAVRELTGMRERIKNPHPALKRVGRYVTELSRQAFSDSADPTTHRPWSPLSEATKRQRRGSPPYKILVDTARLKKSIHFLITGKHSVAVGTNVEYGPDHQFGVRKGRIPAREFLGVDEPGEREIENIVGRYIMEGK